MQGGHGEAAALVENREGGAPAGFGERALRLKPAPGGAFPEGLDISYWAGLDAGVYARLWALPAPRVCDFEQMFNDFERVYFNGQPQVKMLADLAVPPHVRVLTALARYSH